jgi:hypothetical protein
MNWEAIGAIGETLGSLVVIASVIYLALQLRQTNDISRFNTAKELLSRFNEINSHLVSDESLRRLLCKEDQLTPEEEEQLYAFTNLMINVWLSVQEARNAGQVDETLFEAMIRDVDVILERWPLTKPRIEQWLERYPEVKHYRVFEPVLRPDGQP